ncbi:MAG: hypothetical protein WAT79_08470 [Saprospiraceae bacterium]
MQLPNIRNSREIAAGGEGRIIEHPNGKDVIKMYHQKRPLKFQKHLEDLTKLSGVFVKPLEVYTDVNSVLGFSMKYVNLNDYWLFNNLFNKGFCTSNNIDNGFKIKVLNKLKAELEKIHSNKIFVGDLNQYNIFVNEKSEILFVDVDSFKTATQDHSGVLLDDIRDWTTSIINHKSDSWAYDILAFWSMSYVHPFKWVSPGNKETLEQRVKSGKSILTKIQDVKIPALYQPFAQPIVDQFTEIFKGRRYMVNLDGTTFVKTPIVVTQPIPTSDLLIRVVLTDVLDVYANINQISVKTSTNWKLFATDTLKVIREMPGHLYSDFLFPSINVGEFIYMKDNNIISGKDNTINNTFIKPEFYFTEGSLLVIDYAKDIQYNFDVNKQLAGSIHKGNTSIFAKSVLFRGAPIQNFGKKKFLNIPNQDRYFLAEVSEYTKNAIYCGSVIAVESLNKSTDFTLYFNGKPIKNLEYLPSFAKKGSSIFLPEDGFIEVLDKDGDTITKFNVSNCTRSSKLWSTNSGLIMLENKTLYLLNTKQ